MLLSYDFPHMPLLPRNHQKQNKTKQNKEKNTDRKAVLSLPEPVKWVEQPGLKHKEQPGEETGSYERAYRMGWRRQQRLIPLGTRETSKILHCIGNGTLG